MANSNRELIGIAGQSALGTAIGTGSNNFVQVHSSAGSFSASETFTAINDNGRRGNNDAMDYEQYYGKGSTDISWDGAIELTNGTIKRGSVIGVLLRNLFGTGTPATGATNAAEASALFATSMRDYSFRLGTANEYLTVVQKFLGETSTNAKQIKDCKVTSLTITADTESVLSYSTTLMGQPASTGTNGVGITISDASFQDVLVDASTFNSGQVSAGTGTGGVSSGVLDGLVLPNYAGTATSLVSSANIISVEWSFSREATPVYTMTGDGASTFKDIYTGPLEVTTSIVFYMDNAIAQMFRNKQANAYGAVQTAWQKGVATQATERAFGIGANKVSFAEGPMEIDTSASYTTLALSGRALYSNSAQTISGGAYTAGSPVEVRITENSTAVSANIHPYI